ncbi:hypothetical protein DAI22_08g073850 [Oryza sativa Japonica Group]|nr:hypothetical protein DAI22_08g073850 [Oryza sativa Japonica Group]
MGQNPFHPHRHQLLPPAAAVNSARTPPPTPHPCLLRRLPLLFSSSLSSAPIKTTKDTPLFSLVHLFLYRLFFFFSTALGIEIQEAPRKSPCSV